MAGNRRISMILILATLAAVLASVTVLSGCGKTRTGEGGQAGQGETEEPVQAGDALFRETLEVMRGEISYRIMGELDFDFQAPSASLSKTGPGYFSIPVGIPYEALHWKKGGQSASKSILKMDQMAYQDPPPPALIPEEVGNITYLVDGTYYREDPSGWNAEPYDPTSALLFMNWRGLMPEDILNWLVFAESAEALEEKDGAVGYQVKLGDNYLQGMEEKAREALAGERLEKALSSLEALKTLLPSMNIFVVIDKAERHITEVQFAYGGAYADILQVLPADSPFQDMKFFYSAFLEYSGYGSDYQIQSPL